VAFRRLYVKGKQEVTSWISNFFMPSIACKRFTKYVETVHRFPELLEGFASWAQDLVWFYADVTFTCRI